MKVKDRLFLKYLHWQTRPSVIQKYLKDKKIKRVHSIQQVDRRSVQVGAAQLKLELLQDPREYAGVMHRYVKTAAESGVQLLVFPEYNSLQLLGLVPGIESLASKIDGDSSDASTSITDLFRLLAPAFNRVAYTTFSCLARESGLYLMAGSFLTPEEGGVVNRALLFDPGGMVVGVQDKVHLMPLEHEWKLTPGSSFQVFPTKIGRLAMAVCMDATYFETFRILADRGAQIVMVPTADPQQYNIWLALRGIWPRVQESTVYGIKSAMVGKLFGMTFTGRSGVFAPLGLTPKRDGVLAEAERFDCETLVTAGLDLEALDALRNNHPYLGDKNPRLIKRYIPYIYSASLPEA
jgi:predicted amidohydrolase